MSNHTAFSPVGAINLDKWAGWIPWDFHDFALRNGNIAYQFFSLKTLHHHAAREDHGRSVANFGSSYAKVGLWSARKENTQTSRSTSETSHSTFTARANTGRAGECSWGPVEGWSRKRRLASVQSWQGVERVGFTILLCNVILLSANWTFFK